MTQVLTPSEIQAASRRMEHEMNVQQDAFQEISRIGRELSVTGMESAAGRAAANRLADINNNAGVQRERSRLVVSNLQQYANQQQESRDAAARNMDAI